MTYADEIRRQVEAAPRAALPAVTAALWRAYGEGKVTETEAEALSGLIEARSSTNDGSRLRQIPNPPGTAETNVDPAFQSLVRRSRSAVGSRPRTDASMERRRRWAASGRLPPAIAARFTLAEQAVLALVAAETVRRTDCRLSIENMAAVAGVCRSTVKNAIREAARLGLLTVEERQITGFRNDTNVVRVVSREWQAWLRLARKVDLRFRPGSFCSATSTEGGGVKSVTTTTTQVPESGKTRTRGPVRRRSAFSNPPARPASRIADA